ncbi:MAG: O-methyltransferase [Clostridia bacterium]|nr:O-methyltransferase [Clostridia bacterium]
MDIENFRNTYRAKFVPVVRDKTGHLLEDIVKEIKPKRILEFGTAVGLSAILMLKASSMATLDTIEIDAERAKEARINFQNEGLSQRATVIEGDALVVAKKLVAENKKYDLIFLDCAKGLYPKLVPYIETLLNGGGVFVADDVLFFGYVFGEPPKKHRSSTYRIREFIEIVSNSKKLENVQIYEIENGVLVAKRKDTNE